MKCPRCGNKDIKLITRYEVGPEGGFPDEPNVSSRLKKYHYCEKCGWHEGNGEGSIVKYAPLILLLTLLLVIVFVIIMKSYGITP